MIFKRIKKNCDNVSTVKDINLQYNYEGKVSDGGSVQ